MLITKHYKLKTRSAFTLVELMVTIAILGIVVVLVGNLANFTVGRLKSNQLKHTNDAIRSALNLIGQKMNNANAHKSGVYGFKVTGIYPDQVLMIASSDSDDANITCTYFGKRDEKIMMDQDNCSGMTLGNLTHPVTPDKISVETFEFTGKHEMSATPETKIPFVKIFIKAHDKSDPALTNTELETTFTMDGENVKYLNH